jgi:hypothetical protein
MELVWVALLAFMVGVSAGGTVSRRMFVVPTQAVVSRLQGRLAEIRVMVHWWRDQDQDFRGQGVVSPQDVLGAIGKVAEGEELSKAITPALFHECGCPVYVQDPVFHPEGVRWVPPSVAAWYATGGKEGTPVVELPSEYEEQGAADIKRFPPVTVEGG